MYGMKWDLKTCDDHIDTSRKEVLKQRTTFAFIFFSA